MAIKIKSGFPRLLSALTSAERNIIKGISALAAKRGERAYIVGGFARDILLGFPNLDIDCVVEGDACSLAEDIVSELGGAASLNRKFNTAKIKTGDLTIDIASAREEHYAAAGELPSVRLSTIKQDALRRDFTVNALYISINPHDFGKLCSAESHLNDLKKGVIRVFHDGSFEDDPTRIFRAVRFAARFGFRIEPRTKGLILKALKDGMLKNISPFRAKRELMLLLNEINAPEAMKTALSLGLAGKILPDVKKNAVRDLKTGRLIWLDFFIYLGGQFSLPLYMLLILLKDVSPGRQKTFVQNLNFGKKDTAAILFPRKNINKILREIIKNDPAWRVEADALRDEQLLFIVLIAASDNPANFQKTEKRVMDYLLHLKRKKPFHSSAELIRMGFPAETLGTLAKEITRGRRGGEILSKSQEYSFLVRKLKK
ncbi:MAG: hypothetical protein ABII20_04150 [Candidatus Omnitrophota bacterium]|nr:CCA tRNA nucleotidyltransferase [Candidatus Omnitrophota bacterium]MBU3929356.1 hypothetical protein [bacterium]MBU4122471.1 hypothetical protein [bacterium]